MRTRKETPSTPELLWVLKTSASQKRIKELAQKGDLRENHQLFLHSREPQNNNIIPTFSLNGGSGSGAFHFSKYIGIVAEFEGYGSYTHNINTGAGRIYVSGNLFTYNVEPIVNTSHFDGSLRASGKAVWTWPPVVAVDAGAMQIQSWEGATLSRAETVLQGKQLSG